MHIRQDRPQEHNLCETTRPQTFTATYDSEARHKPGHTSLLDRKGTKASGCLVGLVPVRETSDAFSSPSPAHETTPNAQKPEMETSERPFSAVSTDF